MQRTNFALRLLPSLHKAVTRIAEREQCSVNQLINLALAEKLARLDDEYWRERQRKAKANPSKIRWQDLAGNEPPRPGDEIPEEFLRSEARRKSGKA